MRVKDKVAIVTGGAGAIVSISSTAGVIGMMKGVEYSAAKAGIVGMTVPLAAEVAE